MLLLDSHSFMPNSIEPLADWSPSLLADCHASVRGLYEYWDAKRGGRAMPARADLEPADLKKLLPHLILIDVVSDERRYVYRLVGTREVEMRGSDPTGKPVRDAYYAESAEETFLYLDRCVHTAEPVLYRGIYRPSSTRTQQEDTIFLPLSKDGAHVDMILVYGHIRWLKDDPAA